MPATTENQTPIYPGQRMLVLPRPVVHEGLRHPGTSDLLTTDIGYFPSAGGHYACRAAGADQLILIYCVSGRGWVNLGSVRHAVWPGQALVIAPRQPHEYGANPEDPWTIYWLHVAGRKIPALHRMLTDDGARPIFHAGEDPEVVVLFEDAYQTLQQSYGPDHLLLCSLTIGRLLARFIQLHRQHPELLDAKQRVMRTIKFMQHRIASRVSVPELSRLANLSRSHYAAVFKRQTGYPVLDFFIRLKMQRAAYLLDTTGDPIKTIAQELGFEDPLYFSRQFRRVYDISPAQYRAEKKG
jgi:AraC-like DNA-binding protein